MTPQEKCPHMVHFNVPHHMIGLKQTRSIKNITLKVAKKNWVSWSTGKSNVYYMVQFWHFLSITRKPDNEARKAKGKFIHYKVLAMDNTNRKDFPFRQH